VVGGGDSAVKEAIFLTNFAQKIHLIHRRDELRAEKYLQDKALGHPKIEPVWNSVVDEIAGDEVVKSLKIKDVKTGEQTELPVDGVFIFVGIKPNTNFLDSSIKKDDRGFIITDEWMQTSNPGIFAAGDCRAKPMRQIITAVSDGATASFGVEHFLTSQL
jgi:thioredoxin reductase (NADPH)